jgi:hypothetical protein
VFVRTTTRRNKTGQVVRYLQLAHNEWDPASRSSKTKVLHSFGREDDLDRAAIERLVTSLTQLLDPARAAALTGPGDLAYLGSRPLGGTHVLDGLWHRLGLDAAIGRCLAGRRLDPRVERVLFGLVANRVLGASSKLAAASWMTGRVHINGLDDQDVDAQTCYRAMDWLLQIGPELARQAYFQVTGLLNLQVDLIFFDTTSTYFETGDAGEPVARGERGHLDPSAAAPGRVWDDTRDVGFRTFGKSKDSREDLPQVVVGMAVTREGVPVRVWSWPGNTADSVLIRQVKADLREWVLSKVVWVADRGFTSAVNRRALMQGGGGYIIGGKLRSGSPEIKAALSRQGRYATIRDNMQVKEVNVGTGDRMIICFNPAQAERDAAIRADLIAKLEEAIKGSDALSVAERGKLAGVLSTRPGLKRFLRLTPGGLLRVDKKKIAIEANLDGKYLLRSSDPHLSAEDIALGYKQLLEVERGWRDMKQILDLRPVYHRAEDRIRAHVLLCWLGLLLIRVAENATGQTWNRLRDQLEQISLATFAGPTGTYRQCSELTKPQRDLLTALDVPAPKRVSALTPPG